VADRGGAHGWSSAPGGPVAPAADWNLAAARASAEFFVAPDRDEALGRLRSEIGVTNRLHLDRELARAFDPAPEDLLRGADSASRIDRADGAGET
jgi:hypothetical protein